VAPVINEGKLGPSTLTGRFSIST